MIPNNIVTKKITGLILAGWSFVGFAQIQPPMDIYGLEETLKQKIFAECQPLLERYFVLQSKWGANSSERIRLRLKQLEQQIFTCVKKIDDVIIAKPSVVYYPGEDKRYLTLDIVETKAAARVPNSKRFTQQHKLTTFTPAVQRLFEVWRTYNTTNMNLIQQGRLEPAKKSCPVMHCTWGFDKEELKTVLPTLQNGVSKNQEILLEIIQYGSNDEDRAEAIFLVANGNDYEKIANFLLDFTDDPSESVRNNTMRVLGSIALQHSIKNLRLSQIIEALDYPYVTDRNKAAFVLFGIVKNNPEAHAYVIKNATGSLLKMLALQQPNNHDFAYRILQMLSHQNYGEHDYKKWENWAKLARKQI